MSEILPEFTSDLPAQYRIQITGLLASSWVARCWGMASSPIEVRGEPDQTVLFGEVVDQAALIGMLNAIYNMGRAVVSVEHIQTDSGPHPLDTKEEA